MGRFNLSASDIRRYSVLASVDPRTLCKALEGKPILPMPFERILRVLRDHGLIHLLPQESEGGLP